MDSISGVVDWLQVNRPPEPARLAICHGDFHPLNILVQDGKVTGVVDWPNFCIADPAWDVACTIWILTIPARYAFASQGQVYAESKWEQLLQIYLDTYRSRLPLDTTHIHYYRVLRSAQALWDGFKGQEIFQDPDIVAEIAEYVTSITGISILP
jgi:aminoglycoside phosphotransferase (APT) family kinase protein